MKRVPVWVDVGGTFTDCFVNTPTGRRSCKVLSTGLLRGHLTRLDDNQAILRVAEEYQVDRFWEGSILRIAGCVNDGSRDPKHQTTISVYDRSSGRLQLAGPLDREMLESASNEVELITGLEAPVLAVRLLLGIPPANPLPPLDVRIGTTRGTNALLTRSGAKTALLTTVGFKDILLIGEQDRNDLFALDIVKTPPLTHRVIEVQGRLDAQGNELEPLDSDLLCQQLDQLRQEGIESLAICFLHAYLNPAHELAVEQAARAAGFEEVSRSSAVSPLIKFVARAETTVLDAYLNPILRKYVNNVWQQFGGLETCRLRWMTSSGHLVAPEAFRGANCILSGPAGGIISLGEISQRHAWGHSGVIGLDMGGTSTDVCRFEGSYVRRFESRVSGIRVLTPMMDIHTVAAGGGSICSTKHGRLNVGPESAGANPGPACYGRGGPLTVTDLNLLLGRLDVSRFPFPLDQAAAKSALDAVARQYREATGTGLEGTELADGFLQIAVTHMAEAVQVVTVAAGRDARELTLVGFGGAAGQLLCRVASALGSPRILDHPDASLLSARGMGIARVGRFATAGVYHALHPGMFAAVQLSAEKLQAQVCRELANEREGDEPSEYQFTADVRYLGTDAALTLQFEPILSLADRFHAQHQETFGYSRPQRTIELVAVRCEGQLLSTNESPPRIKPAIERVRNRQRLWHQFRWLDATVIDRDSLQQNERIVAPAIVVSDSSVLVVEPGWEGLVLDDGTIELRLRKDTSGHRLDESSVAVAESTDPVLLEIVSRRLQGIADAMGEVLRRTSTSVNVKERRDYSCAVFNRDGILIANAPHVPVHLGAMGHTVRYMMRKFPEMAPGDCFVTNDPFAGGSHLPDVTVVTPVFVQSAASSPDFFVASRAHHAEIGGRTPGSMPPDATCLAEEGVLIRARLLQRHGVSCEEDIQSLLSSGEYPSRSVTENLADLAAQQAAGSHGARLLQQLTNNYPLATLDGILQRLLEMAANQIKSWIATLPSNPRRFQDALDDGTPVRVALWPDQGRLVIDFAGTSDVHPHGFNATPAIVTAAVLYVLRCISGSHLPLNEGVMRQIKLCLPAGLLNPPAALDPYQCAAVVAGNVETSQRIVDCLLGALDLVAASQGTMNNVLFGDSKFGYYETIGGGAGATPRHAGASGVHTHMTNTRITDPEVLESRLPVRLLAFAIRSGSGGVGQHRGGDGLVRRFQFLRPLVVSLITGRRVRGPYGLHGGAPGQPGINTLIRGGRSITLAASTRLEVIAGDELEIQTPGGGGWGTPS